MQVPSEHIALVELVDWIDGRTQGLEISTDERTQLAIGCFDVALEHQGAISFLHSGGFSGSLFALLRVLTEALVRGLWLRHCASEADLVRFRNGKLKKEFGALVEEVESYMGTPNGVLSGFKVSAYHQMNDFTHTGIQQVSRRYAPGLLGPNYSDADVSKALGVAGALGLIAAVQLIDIAGRQDLIPEFEAKMTEYAKPNNVVVGP